MLRPTQHEDDEDSQVPGRSPSQTGLKGTITWSQRKAQMNQGTLNDGLRE